MKRNEKEALEEKEFKSGIFEIFPVQIVLKDCQIWMP